MSTTQITPMSTSEPLFVRLFPYQSADQGAKNPARFMFELAKALGTEVKLGLTWGSDMVPFQEDELPTVLSLLDEARMAYSIHPSDLPWSTPILDKSGPRRF